MGAQYKPIYCLRSAPINLLQLSLIRRRGVDTCIGMSLSSGSCSYAGETCDPERVRGPPSQHRADRRDPGQLLASTPDIGPTSLETIRRVAGAKTQQTASPSSDSLTDAELLDRLQRLQDELRWLQDQLKARLSKAPGRTPNRYWHTTTPPNGADRQEAPQASGHTA